MGYEERERKSGVLVLRAAKGHDASVAHTFNHTDGRCPKCANGQLVNMFCHPGQSEQPRLRSCELEGEHLHRICGACRYAWIERPMDQAMLNERMGVVVAEGQLAACLAVIVERTDGAKLDAQLVDSRRGWILHIARDPERREITVTASPPPKEAGKASHPTNADIQEHLNAQGIEMPVA